MKQTLRLGIIIILCSVSVSSQAGIWDKIRKLLNDNSSSTKALSKDEIVRGLKEELVTGAKRAVQKAGESGGYLKNPEIKIPLPENVKKIGKLLSSLGYGKKVNAFETSMNTAAERAAKGALPVFVDTIKQLTFKDARKILKGGDTAITDYFREKTRDSLYKKFLPIVNSSTNEIGVTKKYKGLVSNPLGVCRA